MSDSVPAALRQFLVRPRTFFAERPPASTLPIAIGVVVLISIATVGTLLLLGSILAGAVDTTVTVDNPNHTPEWACESNTAEFTPAGCGEPETIERDAGELIQQAINDLVVIALLAPLLMWVLGAITFNLTARLAGGRPSLAGTAAIAGWVALPELLRLGGALVAFRVAFSDVTITDPERGAEVLEAAISSIDPVLWLVSLLVAAWQWHIATGGLMSDADLDRGAAAAATAFPLLIAFLLSL